MNSAGKKKKQGQSEASFKKWIYGKGRHVGCPNCDWVGRVQDCDVVKMPDDTAAPGVEGCSGCPKCGGLVARIRGRNFRSIKNKQRRMK